MSAPVQLGLGLIGIGRPWGHVPGEVPTEAGARALLDFAFELGIRYFDTAPSYGLSEARFGAFLGSLTESQRRSLTIATKFGEHWDAARDAPFVDHSFDALRRSLEQSLARLGRIDILQLHKTTPQVLRSEELAKAWEFAASLGIATIGASVSDLESAGMVLADTRYGCIQVPLNRANPTFAVTVDAAGARGIRVAINRPYAMGALPSGREAFAFILERAFGGVILTGTKSTQHLADNHAAFQAARG